MAAKKAKKKAKNPHAVALGRLGGLKGGKARFSKLTPAQRSELGRKAILARWSKRRKDKSPATVIPQNDQVKD